MKVWLCLACDQPCELVFWENRNFKGTSCCMARARTPGFSMTPISTREPRQLELRLVG